MKKTGILVSALLAMLLLTIGFASANTIYIETPAASTTIDGTYNFTTNVTNTGNASDGWMGIINVTFYLTGLNGVESYLGVSTNSSNNQTSFSISQAISTLVDQTYTVTAKAQTASQTNNVSDTNTGVVLDAVQISATYDTDTPADNEKVEDRGKYVKITSASGEEIRAATLRIAGNSYTMDWTDTNKTNMQYSLDAIPEGVWDYYVELYDTNTSYSTNTADRKITLDYSGRGPGVSQGAAAVGISVTQQQRNYIILFGILAIIWGLYANKKS